MTSPSSTPPAPRPHTDVLVEGDVITRVEATGVIEPPVGARVIDGRDRYLIPGLIDAHVHLSYIGEHALDQLITNGVTTARDMGGDLEQIDRWRTAIEAGRPPGP